MNQLINNIQLKTEELARRYKTIQLQYQDAQTQIKINQEENKQFEKILLAQQKKIDALQIALKMYTSSAKSKELKKIIQEQITALESCINTLKQ